jgi:signal transduction histidine kinase
VRPLSARDRLVDAGIAALLLIGAGVTISLSVGTGTTAPVWFNAGWAVLITVPLAWRRRFPIPTATIVIAVFLAGQVTVTPEPLISQIAPFIALYTVGAWEARRRRSVIARSIFVVAIIASVVVEIAIAPARIPQQLGNLSASAAVGLAALSNALYLVAAIGFGETAWRSARRRAVLEVRTDELQAERERTAEQAVALERVRIARELHDVIAHHVSVIGIQAGAARRVLRSAPEKASDALTAIEQNARQAVEELHRTVEALRTSDAPESPSRAASTLGVAQIADLVSEAEQAGTPTTLETVGDPRQLTPVTGLTLYRVTQEALTNVRKHAGRGARVTIRLRYATDSVALDVRNSGGSQTGNTGTPGGMGQLGMRERVSALNGTFEAGPGDDGYVVSVVVPV